MREDVPLKHVQEQSAVEHEKKMAEKALARERLLQNCEAAGLMVDGSTPADGSCFYHAVWKQIPQTAAIPSALDLRRLLCKFMRNHSWLEVRTISVCCVFYWKMHSALILVVLKPWYSDMTGSILLLLMHWFLASPSQFFIYGPDVIQIESLWWK